MRNTGQSVIIEFLRDQTGDSVCTVCKEVTSSGVSERYLNNNTHTQYANEESCRPRYSRQEPGSDEAELVFLCLGMVFSKAGHGCRKRGPSRELNSSRSKIQEKDERWQTGRRRRNGKLAER